MAGIQLLDFLLGIIVLAVVPFVLAAYGGHLAALTLTDSNNRRKTKLIFWGLCFVGIVVAVLYQYRVGKIDQEREYKAAKADAERQRKTDEAQRAALMAQADLRAIEKSNGDQIVWLQKRLDRVIARAQAPDQKTSAQEIRDELAQMAESLKQQIDTAPQTVQSTPTSAPTPGLLTPPKNCRGDSLSNCGDEELLEWGRDLMESISTIENTHIADLKALDEIKGTWAGFLVGKDKDSKWLKAYAEAQEKAADQFRNCCAENALKYHEELMLREGSALQKSELYEWIRELLKPINSKEWKDARRDGGSKVVDITGDLRLLEIKLSTKIRLSKIKQASR